MANYTEHVVNSYAERIALSAASYIGEVNSGQLQDRITSTINRQIERLTAENHVQYSSHVETHVDPSTGILNVDVQYRPERPVVNMAIDVGRINRAAEAFRQPQFRVNVAEAPSSMSYNGDFDGDVGTATPSIGIGIDGRRSDGAASVSAGPANAVSGYTVGLDDMLISTDRASPHIHGSIGSSRWWDTSYKEATVRVELEKKPLTLKELRVRFEVWCRRKYEGLDLTIGDLTGKYLDDTLEMAFEAYCAGYKIGTTS